MTGPAGAAAYKQANSVQRQTELVTQALQRRTVVVDGMPEGLVFILKNNRQHALHGGLVQQERGGHPLQRVGHSGRAGGRGGGGGRQGRRGEGGTWSVGAVGWISSVGTTHGVPGCARWRDHCKEGLRGEGQGTASLPVPGDFVCSRWLRKLSRWLGKLSRAPPEGPTAQAPR